MTLSHYYTPTRSHQVPTSNYTSASSQSQSHREDDLSVSKDAAFTAPSSNTAPVILIQSQYAPPVRIHDFYNRNLEKSRSCKPKRPRDNSPVNQIPPEILSSILLYSMRGFSGLPVERLMAVCGLWMHVCLTNPSLWTKLRLKLDHWDAPRLYERRCNYVFYHLSRSGVLPMQVEVDLSPAAARPDDLRTNVKLAQGILHLLFHGGPTKKGVDSWTELKVLYHKSTPRRLLDFLGTSMPSLQSLCLHGTLDVKVPVMNLPSVSSLSRISCPPPTGYPVSDITKLTLDRIVFDREAVIDLSKYQALESLVMHDNLGLEIRYNKITLPNLTTLEIRSSESTSLRFLILPKLSTVRIPSDAWSVNTAAGLMNISQVKKLQLLEMAWWVSVSSHSMWEFRVHETFQMDGMKIEPSTLALERLFEKCLELEEIEATPSTLKVVRELLQLSDSLCPKLKRLTCKSADILSSDRIPRKRERSGR
jgi:hypothetical protein